jgi:glycine cleavage system H protein
MQYPTDRRYTKDHEWVRVEGSIATIGITAFAQEQLGDIVYVELPASGKLVRAGDVLGTIESVKAVSEIFAPIGGRVREGNAALNDRPELVNREPHGGGWYCTLEPTDLAEVDRLLDAPAYAGIATSG